MFITRYLPGTGRAVSSDTRALLTASRMISHRAVLVLERKSNESARGRCVVFALQRPRSGPTASTGLLRQASPRRGSQGRIPAALKAHFNGHRDFAANTRVRKRRRACIAFSAAVSATCASCRRCVKAARLVVSRVAFANAAVPCGALMHASRKRSRFTRRAASVSQACPSRQLRPARACDPVFTGMA
jgi:hypothetical protein